MLLLVLMAVDLAFKLISPFTVFRKLICGGAKLTGQLTDFGQDILVFRWHGYCFILLISQMSIIIHERQQMFEVEWNLRGIYMFQKSERMNEMKELIMHS